MNRKTSKKDPSKTTNQLRIIGGLWRGRKLIFPSADGLRPTGDRIRETLFNWLAPYIEGANCLDLFCGSGALGLEALSRGAASVTFVDNSTLVIDQIRRHLETLDAIDAELVRQNALQWLAELGARKGRKNGHFDIVFLDPPFASSALSKCIALLHDQPILKSSAWVYIETSAEAEFPAIVEPWRIHRRKTAGKVEYALITSSLCPSAK